MTNFRLLCEDGAARRGVLKTNRGDVKTPFFMNVATAAAIKGGISAPELADLKCKVMLCNTYHLHLRPTSELIAGLGGLHQFTRWDKPLLTDSGGFQVFSLAKIRSIREEGVEFRSHLDGSKVFISPEKSMQIQSNFGSTIAMAFDECVAADRQYSYFKDSCERTMRWLDRSIAEVKRLNSLDSTINKEQMIFGINQGGTFKDLRIENAKQTVSRDIDGFALGGLAVGETAENMYEIIETVMPYAPEDKPRYLMGVGTPQNILEAVYRGIDMFDCVMPTRNARHGTVFTSNGILHLRANKYKDDERPIDENCGCPTCQKGNDSYFTRAYLRHLFKAEEYLAGRLCCIHNLYFYNNLMEVIGENIENGTFEDFYKSNVSVLGTLI